MLQYYTIGHNRSKRNGKSYIPVAGRNKTLEKELELYRGHHILCKDCKHWSDNTHNVSDVIGDYSGHLPPIYGSCLASESFGKAVKKGTMAVAMDVAMHHGYLLTSPDFSCLQGERSAGPCK